MEAVRTCIGCRDTDQRDSLVRLVAGRDAVEVDDTASAPGRGAWLHPRSDCWEKAMSRSSLPRALRSNGLDTSRLIENLHALNDSRQALRHHDKE